MMFPLQKPEENKMCKVTTFLRRIETLSRSLRGKSEFGVLENKMPRGIFGLGGEGYRGRQKNGC